MFTQKEINQFHKNGIIIAKGLIRGDELIILQNATAKVVSEGMANSPQQTDIDGPSDYLGNNKFDDHIYLVKEDGSYVYRRSERMWDRDDIFKAVTVNPELLIHYGQLTGHAFMPMHDSFVCKIPEGDVPVLWHQDPPYCYQGWNETQGIPNIDADIYLDNSTKENGCIWGIPGHHLVGHVEIENFSEEDLFNHPDVISFEAEPGDVIFHSLSAPHGSIGNKTKDLRRTFYIHFANYEVYKECYSQDPGVKRRKDERGLFFDFNKNSEKNIRDMVEKRKSMGYEIPDENIIRINQQGFEFLGEPKTSLYHWNDLSSKISIQEKRDKQQLGILKKDQNTLSSLESQ